MIGWQTFTSSKNKTAAETEKVVQIAEKMLSDSGETIQNSLQNQSIQSIKEIKKIEKLDPKAILKVENEKISGIFSRQGLSFNELTLKKYKETIEEGSPEVELLNRKDFSYYSDLSFTPTEDTNIELPNKMTIWEADSDVLTNEKPVTLTWANREGIKFIVKIELDNDYLFKIERSVINSSLAPISLSFSSKIHKEIDDKDLNGGVAHEGTVGFFNKELIKVSYSKLLKKDSLVLRSKDKNEKLSWIGFGDKYWLSSLIMNEKNTSVIARGDVDDNGRFVQIDSNFPKIINPNEEFSRTEYLFAGAKELALLDKYESEKGIIMFDHAVDFGSLYFITKPIFMLLQWIYKVFGNFGIAIMTLTLIIKFLLFPLTKKSVVSMAKMKKLQPRIDAIKEKYKDDKTRMNIEIVTLFKTEKISPFSSILPMLLQIPVFFALYKVLYITIEMRQATFFGWIKDLSARDSFNIFSIFDPLHLNVSHYFNLGILSLILCGTMILQQKMQPKPATDNGQIAMIKWMPLIFMFISASFPAGLLIYWSWNNIVSVFQQIFIEKVMIKDKS
jgi:YidC/Oxa1 family membrane protein insertase